MSLVKLSQLTGISKSALSNYENGHRYPSIEQLERIAVAFDRCIAFCGCSIIMRLLLKVNDLCGRNLS